MISILRKNQRILMLVIAILTIIAFAFLYNPTKPGELSTNAIARIYDKNLTQADIDREVKNFGVAMAMQQFELISDLGGMAQNENEALAQFIWNLLVLQHEARELGIEPTDAQVAGLIKSVGIFQTNGQFDPRKYAEFLQEQLAPRGFTERQLESVIRDSLRLDRLKLVIGAPVTVSEAEIREAARTFEKADLYVVRFSLEDAMTSVQVSPEEMREFYERNKRRMGMPETRAVEYVEFALPADKQSAQGKEKIEAQQKVADAASAFVQSATGKAFSEAAGAAGLAVKTTPPFTSDGTVMDAAESPSVVKDIAPAAFLLAENAVSDVVEGSDKFYVLKVARVLPARPISFEEALPQLENQLKQMKAQGAVKQAADAQIETLRASLAGGKTFTEAAAAAGINAETFEALNPQAADLTAEQRTFLEPALLMQPGQLSGMLASPIGSFAVYLAKRDPLDEATYAKERQAIQEQILNGKRRLLFATWLDSAREAAKISMAQRGGEQ